MSRSEPESCQSVLTVESSFAPRQQRPRSLLPRSLLPHLQEFFDSAVVGFWSALNRRTSKQPNSCIPLLTRRRVVRRTASWPRLASGRREQSSPSVQPGSSVAGYRRSRSCPTLLSGYVDVTEPRTKYSSDIFKTASPTSLSGDVEEELHCVTPPAFKSMSFLYNSSPECYIDDDLSYLIEGIDELKGFRKRKQGDSRFDEQDGDGNSTVTTVSENESAISSASQDLLEPRVRVASRFRGVWQKEDKYNAEIRPSCSKKTVWLGTYATEEEAALAFDAGIFYFRESHIPFNFPDSPVVLPEHEPGDVSTNFVKMAARRNAKRARPSGARYTKPRIHGQSSSAGSSAGSSTGSSRIWFKRVKKMESIGVETFGKPGQYTLAEVLVATHKYAKQIGESLSGRVYWVKLETGQEVAVKVWAEGSHQAETESHIFRRVCFFWREHHKYLVQLIGYCEEGGEQISIYEYMPGGSLQEHLHEKGMLNLETHALDWGTRLKIALNVAQGLQSLHAGNYFGTFHENIQSFQVFLTEKNWVPRSVFTLVKQGCKYSTFPMFLHVSCLLSWTDSETRYISTTNESRYSLYSRKY